MDFIIGGRAQGKTAYVRNTYGLGKEDIFDGNSMELEARPGIRAVCNFHLWVKRAWKEYGNPVEMVQKLIEENPDIIIIMDEVGNGIVPIEKEERLWREEVGRCGCYLAKEADKVIRLVCGLPQQLK